MKKYTIEELQNMDQLLGLISASERHTLHNPRQGAQRRSLGVRSHTEYLNASLGEADCALARNAGL